MNNIKQRKVWIDWLKSIAIMFVIFGHLPMWNDENKAFVCSFHMPLFFIISGYLYKPSESIKSCFLKCVHTLLVPYFLFNILFYPYWYIMKYTKGFDISTINTAILKPLIGILFGQHESAISSTVNGVTWFLIALFFTEIITEVIIHKKHKTLFFILTTVLTIGLGMYINSQFISTTFTIQSFMKLMPFFFGGIMIKQIDFFEKYNKKLYPLFAFLFLGVWFLFIPYDVDPYRTPIQALSYYLVGFSGSLFIISCCRLLDSFPNKIVYIISLGNIIIFGFHWMFIGFINFVLKRYWGIEGEIGYNLLESIGITLFITSLLYPIILITKKYFPILMGKR